MTLNNDSKYLTLAEVLERINEDVTSLEREYRFSEGSALHRIFTFAFDDKWALPEGYPPFTPNKFVEGASPTDLLIMIRRGRLEYFSSKAYPDLMKSKREELFIRTLESVHAKEAEVLLMIKDQTLTKKYPNITRDVLVRYGYLPKIEATNKEETKSTPVEETKPTKTTKKRTTRTKKATTTTSKAKK